VTLPLLQFIIITTATPVPIPASSTPPNNKQTTNPIRSLRPSSVPRSCSKCHFHLLSHFAQRHSCSHVRCLSLDPAEFRRPIQRETQHSAALRTHYTGRRCTVPSSPLMSSGNKGPSRFLPCLALFSSGCGRIVAHRNVGPLG